MQRTLLLLCVFLFNLSHYGAESTKPENIRVENKKTTKGTTVIVHNTGPGHFTLTMEVTLNDAVASENFPLTTVVKPGQSLEAFQVSPRFPNKPWTFSYKFGIQLGNKNAKLDPETPYLLPYPVGTTHTVIQGYGGNFSHQGELQYSIDWEMPEGSQVCAARDGVVVGIKIDSDVGGDDREKFFDKGNFIAIEHTDGSVGYYYHLKHNGASVKMGQAVKAGDAIGLSGMTGFTSQAHLHFHVHVPLDGRTYKTVPVKFLSEIGVIKELEKDQGYTAAAAPKKEETKKQ